MNWREVADFWMLMLMFLAIAVLLAVPAVGIPMGVWLLLGKVPAIIAACIVPAVIATFVVGWHR